MAIQDRNVVRTAADLEKKYNFAKLLGLTTNVEKNAAELVKVENELNNMLNSLIINLGDVLDSQSSISLWFYEGIPTTSNKPYIDWITPADHYGDFYYDQASGYVYKYTSTGWILQDDENLIQAMAMTNVELDVSQDHERQVYFSQPTPPYSNGDWWILEDGTLMICQISRATGDYQDEDFIVANKYTPTIASAEGDIITIKQGQVIKMSDTFASFTDLATGGSTTIAGENISTGSIKSNNYVANTTGTKINLSDGSIDSKNFKVDSTGTITAKAGTIGSFTLNSNRLYSGSSNACAGIGVYGEDMAFWAGSETSALAPFRVGHDGLLIASNANITGAINATSGTFSGTISTSQNCTVGDNLYIGQNQSGSGVDSKYLFFSNDVYLERTRIGSSNYLTLVSSGIKNIINDFYTVQLGTDTKFKINSLEIWLSQQPTIGSDKRLKDKIKDVDVSWIDDLKVKEYEYKNVKDKKQIGLIAQDYENKDYAKYFLNKDKNDYYSIQYGNITNALIQYCQELKKDIQNLKEEINKLKEER